jgi:hypothetical protein
MSGSAQMLRWEHANGPRLFRNHEEERIMTRTMLVCLALCAVVATGAVATAGGVEPCAPAVKHVQKTVLCPTWVMEDRVVCVTEYTKEQRTCKYTEYQRIPERKEVQRQCTVMVPETRSREVTYTVCKPIWKEEERTYTVMVPRCETREGTRQVCKMVPVKKTRTVCEDQGHWEERTKVTKAGACDPCKPVKTCTRWVPNLVKKEVEVTCMKPTMVSEPCTYTVTVCEPQERTCKVKVCSYVKEQKTKTVCETVCVPKTKTWTETCTTYKCVPVEKTRTYTVCVPHKVEKTCQVRVCKMVPKTVEVSVCEASCRCEKHGCARVHRVSRRASADECCGNKDGDCN